MAKQDRTRHPKVGGVPAGVEDIMQAIREAVDEATADLGRFNLLAIGNTGAGKSSLINAVFGWKIAETGIGRPVTDGTKSYEHPHHPITFFDTRGIEIGEGKAVIVERLVGEIKSRQMRPIEDQIHVAWYCLRWSDRRLEDGQADVIRAVAATGVPVILVMTQVPQQDGRCHPDAIELAESIVAMGLPLSPGSGVILTAAINDPWTGGAHGLPELLDATLAVVPEGARNALVASQQIDLQRKRDASGDIVLQHAAMSATAAASPIPFSDAAALVPIQLAMIARVTAIWGLDVSKRTLANVIGSALLTSGATYVGRQIVAGLLKLIPGIGWLAGAALNAGVASGLTLSIGTAWTTVVEALASKPENVSTLSSEEVNAAFKQAFRPGQEAA